MSTDNWADGRVKIPPGSWAGFRTSLIKQFNALVSRSISDLASKRKRVLSEATKLGYPKNITTVASKLDRDDVEQIMRNAGMDYDEFATGPVLGNRQIRDLLFERLPEMHQRRVGHGGWRTVDVFRVAPRLASKQYQLPVTKDAEIAIAGTEAMISLDNQSKSVRLLVWSNNRAVERAMRNDLVRKMMGLLERIEFTRNSGGTIYTGDEYSDGRYPLVEFGPKKGARKRKK